MSDMEHIVLRTGLTPEETALRLAAVLKAEIIRHDDGGISVRRPISSNPDQTIGGQVTDNDLGEEQPIPGDETVYDAYDTIYELWTPAGEEGIQHAEAKRIFDEIVANVRWPAAHTAVSGLLYSAFLPGRGRTDFPTGTTYTAENRSLWHPYLQS
jgi:hypothetical protein